MQFRRPLCPKKRSSKHRSHRTTLLRHRPLCVEPLEPRQLLSIASPFAAAAPANKIPAPDHIVLVFEENRAYDEIIGSSSAPYINSLASGSNAAVFTQSFALEHPSQPNYLDLFSGSNQGVTDDNVPAGAPFSTPNLGSELLAAGKSFAGYAEDLPAVGFTGASQGEYVRKHCPWVNWQGSGTNQIPAADSLPLTSFPADFNALPTMSIVIPNLNDDMHDGTIAGGDAWLQQHLNSYIQWAKTHNSLFILTFDEDDYTENNQIPTLMVGSMVQQGQYSEQITHYNVLRTMEDMYGLPYAGQSASVAPISDIWASSPLQPPTVATAASASPATVFGTTTNLSVLGADAHGEAGLTYTWVATAMPAGAASPLFNVNGNNAAKNTTVSFSQAGRYAFQVTIADPAGLSVTSATNVLVSQTLSRLTISPTAVILGLGAKRQLAAAGFDQFGAAMAANPAWTATAGTITAAGLYHAPAGAAKGTVTAKSGSLSATVAVQTVAVVPFAAWEFNENGGTLAGNATARKLNGTILNATWTTGADGSSALHFNGATSMVSFGAGPGLSGTTDFTISAWVRTSAASAGVILEQNAAGGSSGYRLRMTAAGAVEFSVYMAAPATSSTLRQPKR
ncbi:MAG: alkaline phosphatase family protein [Thermoguttaceae bacterium]